MYTLQKELKKKTKLKSIKNELEFLHLRLYPGNHKSL